MESLLYEMRKDAFEKAKGTAFGERFYSLIYWLGTMAETCRKNGLLALEGEAAKVPPEIGLYREIQWVVQIICDVYDPEDTMELFTTRYWASNFQGEDALLYDMTISAFRRIQAGESSPYVIERFLVACLPCDAAEQYEAYRQRTEAPKRAAKRESMFKYAPVFEEQEMIAAKAQLEEKIGQADDKTVQRVLCETEFTVLLTALHGLSPAAKQKLLSNIKEEMVDLLAEDWEETKTMESGFCSDLREALGKMRVIFEEVEKKESHT